MNNLVLCFSGFDPTGGAGIQADIESINANNANVMGVITAITSQNTSNLFEFKTTDCKLVESQALAILKEFTPKIVKIGMVASCQNLQIITKIIKTLTGVKVVYDPVIKTGTQQLLSNDNLLPTIKELLPYTTLITPNQQELDYLGGVDKLFESGVKNILLTTSDTTTEKIIKHYWYFIDKNRVKHYETFECEKLNNKFHGSGCTLASSISANLANQQKLSQAIKNGLNYTWQTLKNAKQSNSNQLIPDRFFKY